MLMTNINPIATARTAVSVTKRCVSIRRSLRPSTIAQEARAGATSTYACRASPTRTCTGIYVPRKPGSPRTGLRSIGPLPRWSTTSTASRSTPPLFYKSVSTTGLLASRRRTGGVPGVTNTVTIPGALETTVSRRRCISPGRSPQSDSRRNDQAALRRGRCWGRRRLRYDCPPA